MLSLDYVVVIEVSRILLENLFPRKVYCYEGNERMISVVLALKNESILSGNFDFNRLRN